MANETYSSETSAILDRYIKFGPITDPGSAANVEFLKSQPDEFSDFALSLRRKTVHPFVYEHPEYFDPYMRRVIDMYANSVPENLRVREDFTLVTVESMIDALRDRNPNGMDQKTILPWKNRLCISCAPLSYLAVSGLRVKGIPARVRAGFTMSAGKRGKYGDHWVIERWARSRWIMSDIDQMDVIKPDSYDWADIPEDKFFLGAEAWLHFRYSDIKRVDIHHGGGAAGLSAVAWQFAYDLGSIIGKEPIYKQHPVPFIDRDVSEVEKKVLDLYDEMAVLMLNPDRNYNEISEVYAANKEYFECISNS